MGDDPTGESDSSDSSEEAIGAEEVEQPTGGPQGAETSSSAEGEVYGTDAEPEPGPPGTETADSPDASQRAGESGPEASETPDDESTSEGGQEESETADTVSRAYAFSDIGDDRWPPDVEYTPKYDEDWVYTVGGRAGGSRDDVPVQGLELQVAAPAGEIESVVKACMDGLTAYEAAIGEVPRHMFVSDTASFDSVSVDGAGTVAVFQPRADDDRSLVDHMTAFGDGTTDPADLTPNRERTRQLATHLHAALAAADVGADAVPTYRDAGGPPRPIADGRVYERYAALGAEGLYDPTDGPADMDSPGADGTDALGFEPRYLDIDHPNDLDPEADELDGDTDPPTGDDEAETTDDGEADEPTGSDRAATEEDTPDKHEESE